MRNLAPLLGLATTLTLLLTGCADQRIESIISRAHEPTAILEYCAYVGGVLLICFIIFGEFGIVGSIGLTLMSLGGILLFVSPIMFLIMNDSSKAMAVGISGILGLVGGGVIYLVTKPRKKKSA
jgi:membrane-bound ClpP family serine protease